MKKTLFITFTILILTGMLSTALRHAEGFNPWPIDELIGNAAPDFTVDDMNGSKVRLSSFKGKPVLLNFWATSCGYCIKERPHLNDLYKEYKSEDLIVVSVSIDGSRDRVKRFLKKYPSDFIVLHDSKRDAAALYRIMGTPTSYLINSKGIIKQKFPGYVHWMSDPVKELIDKLIKD